MTLFGSDRLGTTRAVSRLSCVAHNVGLGDAWGTFLSAKVGEKPGSIVFLSNCRMLQLSEPPEKRETGLAEPMWFPFR